MRTTLGVGVLLCAALATPALTVAQDLRQQYGTRSAAAATALDEGIKLVQQKKAAQAMAPLDRAIAADPDLQLAHYWKALAQVDQGDVDESLATLEKLVEIAERTQVSNVSVDACINAGLTLAQLKEEEKASIWFTKAIMLDPANKNKLHWKAYRNMAIGHHLRDRNLTAALCAMNGYIADPRRVELKMVAEFLDRAEKDEVAQLLSFGDKVTKPTKRITETSLVEASTIDGLSGAVVQLLPDAIGNRMIAIARGEAKYYLIDCAKQNAVQAVDAPGNIVAATIAGGELYLSIASTGLVQVDVATGKEVRQWKLPAPPTSFAMLPAKGVALFPVAQVLTTLDLATGATKGADYYVDTVVADPQQRFVYGMKRSEERAEVGHVIINGRPVMLQRSRGDWMQTSLLKFAVAEKQPILAELRMNVASNGRVLHLSPDGQWVGIAGGGGWRPNADAGQGAGYGIALFAAADFAHVQGFFATDAYPQTVAINSVTGQVAAVRAADAKIYDLAKSGVPTTIAGKFAYVASWSPDGRYLYLAGESGLQAWQNTLSDDEVALATNLQKQAQEFSKTAASAKPSTKPATAIEPIVEYQTFEIKNDKEATLEAIKVAIAKGNPDRPQEWLRHAPYQEDMQLAAVFSELVNKLDSEGAGLRIYQLKKLKQKSPEHPGIHFLLGMSYYAGGQTEAATAAHLAALRADQGRTNLSTEALRCLAEIERKGERPQAAAFCMAHLVRLDRGANRIADAARFFEQAEVTAAAQALLQTVSSSPASATDSDKLPALELVQGEKALTAQQIFAAAVPSVVLIRTADGTGSGVCIGEPGLIVTNAHVVGGERGTVKVTLFQVKDGEAQRLDPVPGRVVFQSEEEDIAIVRIADPPKSLVPLALEAKALQSGAKVYAVGSPGLGEEVLEQTISDGIVSSPQRSVRANTFVQHTASVNPGNSGGPLLNEYGHIVGIVTLKADLQNVNFAIPIKRLKTLYEQQRMQ